MPPSFRRAFAFLSFSLLSVVTHAALAVPETDPVSESIRERVEQVRAHHLLTIDDAHIMSSVILPELYEKRVFRPLWNDPGKVRQLIDAIRSMEADGLVPDDYHLGALERLHVRAAYGATPAEVANLDLLATDGFILMLYHLYLGKVDPPTLDTHWNIRKESAERADAANIIGDAIERGQITQTVERARPSHPIYEQGRKLLADYRAIAATGGWPTVPAGPALKHGTRDARVRVLRQRLAASGDLNAANPDSEVFDDAVEEALKRLQSRHGLTPDGVAGKATLDALNVPVSVRIDQIRVNLERGRWVLHEIAGEFVLVDIAGFDVTYYRDSKPIFRGRAVVGKPFRQSPVFKDQIEYIVFNPTWTVPPTILRNDVLPKLARDPNYLAKHNMRRLDGEIVQQPGPNNALGRVKIMFPNPHLVYLHDTPSRSLFERDQRAFSSGCIRVENVLRLAELLLDDPQKWSEARIHDVIASGRTTTAVLWSKVPVLLLYWTVDFDDHGRPQFRRDIYDRDPPVLKGLKEKFSVGKRRAA